MKAIVAIALFAGLTANAKAPVIEETLFECKQFTSPTGNPLLGVSAPKIVRFPYDSSLGTIFYVKTKVVYPGATPKYTKLMKVSDDAEGTVWESKTYSLNVKVAGTAVIATKGMTATCVQPAAQ